MTISRSAGSSFPCNDTTECPSAVIRLAISSAVARVCYKEMRSEGKDELGTIEIVTLTRQKMILCPIVNKS